MPSRKRFVVIVESGSSEVPRLLAGDDSEDAIRFATREDARAAAVGAMWEHAWVWWIVELTDGGDVVYGLDVEAPSPEKGGR